MTNAITTKNTMTEIVAAYNSLTDLKVKKFSTKEVGVSRLRALEAQVSVSTDSVLAQVLDPIEKAGGLFKTCEVDLTLPNGDVVPNKKGIIDCDTEEYVSTVGTTYQVIENREAFTHFANVLSSSNLNTDGMKVRSTITKARTFIQFTFPQHSVEVRPGDLTELQITARNSYDGSTRFSLDIGGFRLLCSNGMGIGSYTNCYSNKHSTGYSEKKMAEYLETAVEVFTMAGEEWKRMVEVAVTDDQALEVLKIMVERKSDKTYAEILEGKNGILKDALAEWERYKKEMGSNKFSLYNTVTHLSTHCSTKSGDLVGLKIYKEKVRDKALSSAAFRKEVKVA